MEFMSSIAKLRFSARAGRPLAFAAIAGAFFALAACDRAPEFDENLLENGSFETLDDGFPANWELEVFRGVEGDPEIQYGIDEEQAADGERSFFFRADPGTRRFYVLSQEVEIPKTDRVRLTGWMQIDQVDRKKDQWAQCNFVLTFFDENHSRFQELRFADKRTRLQIGTKLWYQENRTFRVPDGTKYVKVGCVLGMDGKAWFDAVSLSIPAPFSWETATTDNYVFHWFPDHPFPAGSMANQQRIFDTYASRLGIESDVVINYYLYPDTATIRRMLSLKGYDYVSWDDNEFHSINPNEDHEVIHFITDPYGMPPRSIAEGTVYWLQGQFEGKPVHEAAADVLRAGGLPSLAELTNYNEFAMLDYRLSLPAAASFVAYIVEGWGVEKLLKFYTALHGVNSYVPFKTAFEKVYEMELDNIEQQWLEGLERIAAAKANEP